MSLAQDLEQIVTVRAPAKVNLTLRVGAVAANGYHPLETVYQAIGLYDDVTVVPASEWQVEVNLVGETPGLQGINIDGVPRDGTNIAIRAGQLLADFHEIAGAASISISKGIPVAAGLAGGSADAAATLVALDRLWDLHTSDDDLLDLAAQLGSDVPFALIGGTAYGSGRGEQVEAVDAQATNWFVVVPSDQGLATPAVYAEFDRGGPADPIEPPTELIELLRAGEPLPAAALRNDLTGPAFRLMPELQGTVDRCRELGADEWLLSGSGPTLLFPAASGGEAQQLRATLIEGGLTQSMAAPGPVAGAHVVNYV